MICMNINIECYDILMERKTKEKEKPFNPHHHKYQVVVAKNAVIYSCKVNIK